MYDISIVPFPAEDDFFAWSEVPEGKDAERNGGLWGAENRTDDGVGTTSAASKARLVAGYAGIEGEVERWADEMDKGFGHAEMGVGVEWICEVGGRGGD